MNVEQIMELADQYANSGPPHYHRQREYEALRAAIVEALAPGELMAAASFAVHQLEKARVWGGMEWHYNPLHPLHYRSAHERLRYAIDAAKEPK